LGVHIRDFAGLRVHFIGIGGVSMSGLAEILISRGYTVSGSDRSENALTAKLRALGAEVYAGHRAGQERGAALIVKNAAIPDDNPELAAARAQGVPVMERTELLGQIMGEYRTAVGVCGTHGKTTTTSMLTTILTLTGRDPTAHIGSELALINGTTRTGSHDLFVAESCEYKDGFLRLSPTIVVMLNIDADHLDYFRDIDHIEQSFAAFADRLPADGLLIGNGDDARVCRIMAGCGRRWEAFGLGADNGWRAQDIASDANGCAGFTLRYPGGSVPVRLSVPGRHNVMNALAALAAAAACGVSPDEAAPALAAYTGAARRFEKIGERGGALLYHDYAHHPTEVAATLAAARQKNPARLLCVFQPHTYTRTRMLFDAFTRCFDDADEVVLLPIYAAREPDPGDISSQMLSDAISMRPDGPPCRCAADFEDAAGIIRSLIAPGDIVLTLGAGDIEALGRLIRE
jgi:UDP-N-acetylmuramate--alanine ligase